MNCSLRRPFMSYMGFVLHCKGMISREKGRERQLQRKCIDPRTVRLRIDLGGVVLQHAPPETYSQTARLHH